MRGAAPGGEELGAAVREILARGVVECQVVELDPPRRLAYTWKGDPSAPAILVAFMLTPVDELKGRGVRFTEEPTRQPWGVMQAQFVDADGKRFVLAER